jgi:phage terminase Nu1 subunit (DNA packaging protein)
MSRQRASNSMNEGKPAIVSAAALGRELGISGSRARELASTVFVRVGNGYDLEASRAAYMASLRRAATGRRGPHKASSSSYGDERIRLARMQADAIELKNKQARRELIEEAEVESTWLEIVARARAAVLAAPARIASDLPHLSKFDIETIDRHLRDALTRLAAGP